MNGSGILWFDSPLPSKTLNLLRSFKMVERTCNIKNQDIIRTRGILFFRKSKKVIFNNFVTLFTQQLFYNSKVVEVMSTSSYIFPNFVATSYKAVASTSSFKFLVKGQV